MTELKTLKDISDLELFEQFYKDNKSLGLSFPDHEDDYNVVGNKKGFEEGKRNFIVKEYTCKETLKQEAIKWIRKDIEDWNSPGGLFQSQIMERWMERFNITEEDLK